RGLIVGLDGGQGLVAFVDQAAAAGQEVAAGVGQFDPAGGAVEQTGLQAILQPSDLPTDGRGRQAQTPGGGREAGLFGDSGEFVDPVPAAHRDVGSGLLLNSNNVLRLSPFRPGRNGRSKVAKSLIHLMSLKQRATASRTIGTSEGPRPLKTHA